MLILWFCWYGFNAGSVYYITTKDHAALAQNAAISTTLAPASGALSALLAKLWISERETGEPVFSLSDTLMGCISGLVSITGGCAYFQSWASIAIGFISGLVYLAGSRLIIRFGVDDAVDAVSISLNAVPTYDKCHKSYWCCTIIVIVAKTDPSSHVVWNVG